MSTHETPDPWESARHRVHDEVAAALAPRTRTCPHCGEPQTGDARTCTKCGGDLVARRPARRWRWYTVAGIVAVLAAAIAGAVAVTAPTRRDARAEARRERAAQAALQAAEIRRLRRDVRPVRAQGPPRRAGEDALAHRRELVATAQRLITRDARARIRAGTMPGPVLGTDCAPYPPTTTRRQAESDPAVPVGRYECIAYSSRFQAPVIEGKKRTGLYGSPFWVVIDYHRSTLVWCKVTPRVGEGGRSLASVPVPPPCRDPLRPKGWLAPPLPNGPLRFHASARAPARRARR